MTAAALVAARPGDVASPQAATARSAAREAPPAQATAPDRGPRAAELVTAPVRIADAAAVRLLHPGDRVDVVAAGETGARVVAPRARVVEVPEAQDTAAEGGALVVLSVPRPTAARLAGAAATSRLAVTLW
ncbi:hypothetical protein ACWCP6_07960 [Streptomyces sp. NPDC002004]